MMDRQIVVPLFSLLETRDNPTVLVDKHYRIVAANKAYCTSYGVPADEIVGKTCHSVSHHSDRPCHLNGEQCPHQAVFATSAPSEALHTHIDFQGRPDHVRILAHPIHDAHSQMYMMESIHRLAPRIDIDCDEMRMAGQSPAFLHFYEELSTAARTAAPVWLYGESGVGKELAARFLHEHSSRAKKAYVELNCASIPESLCESELFGYDKGAFTGGVRAKRGLFELADGGTLFLDEIGDLPLAMQSKLLRVLDSGEFRRLGSESTLKCDVRIVSATNRDLAAMVREGSFRQDLYYRIVGYKVTLPPLRDRKQDIRPIAEIILNRLSKEMGVVYRLAQDALDLLLTHDYPGNIRELRSVLIKASAQCKHGIIQGADISFEHLPGCLCTEGEPATFAKLTTPGADGVTVNFGRRSTDRIDPGLEQNRVSQPTRRVSDDTASAESELSLAQIEEMNIRKLMAQLDNRRVVADKLGISERTLYRKLKKYGLHSMGQVGLAVTLSAVMHVPIAESAMFEVRPEPLCQMQVLA